MIKKIQKIVNKLKLNTVTEEINGIEVLKIYKEAPELSFMMIIFHKGHEDVASISVELGYYDKYLNKEVAQKILLISISAPFYREIWFWSLIAFLITAIVFWFYSRRKLAKQQQEFKQQLALE